MKLYVVDLLQLDRTDFHFKKFFFSSILSPLKSKAVFRPDAACATGRQITSPIP